jgi:hypothetical protein
MDIDELFDTFGVETEKAVVIDRVYVPNCVTVAELVSYSLRKRKPLNMVKRGRYVSIINSKGWAKKEYRHLSEKSRRLLSAALDKADTKNAGYWGQ